MQSSDSDLLCFTASFPMSSNDGLSYDLNNLLRRGCKVIYAVEDCLILASCQATSFRFGEAHTSISDDRAAQTWTEPPMTADA